MGFPFQSNDKFELEPGLTGGSSHPPARLPEGGQVGQVEGADVGGGG